MTAKPLIIVLRESTLLRAVWRRLLGKPFFILGVNPWLPFLLGPLNSLCDWLLRGPSVKDLVAACPKLLHVRNVYAEIYLYNIFQNTESWQNGFFEFDAIERAIPDYAMAYKHATCNYMSRKYLPILVLSKCLAELFPGGVRTFGLDRSTVKAAEICGGQPLAGLLQPVVRRNYTLINFFLFLAITATAALRVLLQTRPLAPKPEHYFFTADYISDVRDTEIYEEIADGGPALLALRFTPVTTEEQKAIEGFRQCRVKDGRFGLLGALSALAFVLADGFKIFYTCRKSEPGLFYQACALPYRRALWRGFFNRFKTRFFWGRDEYNSEHIIRTQEARRAGGETLGILHSTLHYAFLFPMWRHISFDRFYVHGSAVQEYYKDTWDAAMTVKAVGSFGGTREDYLTINQPRPKDIAVFAAILTGHPEFVKLVRALATAFPDRKVYLQIKPNYARMVMGREFAEACAAGLSNVVLTDEPIFSIFPKVQYGFSDPSACVSEALQFGVTAFMADFCDFQEVSIFRNYPGLCVTSGDEAATRLRDIESGAWEYPRSSYESLVDLSGQVFFDVLRKDMGLPQQ